MKPISIVLAIVLLIGISSACSNPLATTFTAPPVQATPVTSTAGYFPLTQPSTRSTQVTLSIPELIDAALARGEITDDQRLLYLTYAIYEPASLPEEFRSNVPWHGTLIVQEIKRIVNSKETFCTLAVEIQREIRRLIPESVECLP